MDDLTASLQPRLTLLDISQRRMPSWCHLHISNIRLLTLWSMKLQKSSKGPSTRPRSVRSVLTALWPSQRRLLTKTLLIISHLAIVMYFPGRHHVWLQVYYQFQRGLLCWRQNPCGWCILTVECATLQFMWNRLVTQDVSVIALIWLF